MNQSMNAFSAAGVKLDSNGKGSFPAAPPGVYYVMGMVAFENQPVYWDMPETREAFRIRPRHKAVYNVYCCGIHCIHAWSFN